MPSLVESVSPRRVAVGVLIGLLAAALVAFEDYRPAPPVAVAVVLLVLVVAARGLRPFGDTVAYHLLQAAVFAYFGLAVAVAEGLTLLPAVFTLIGVAGLLNYGWRAARRGVWTVAE